MTTLYESAFVTDALVTFLGGLGFPVGDHRAPDNATSDRPYLVVHFIDTQRIDGGLSGVSTDAMHCYQISSVGTIRGQAETLADVVRSRMLSRDATGTFTAAFPTMTGIKCHDRITEGSSGVITEGTAPNEVYTFPERFHLAITPA
jgi:hypothetical protein